ncbi:MULTISPECIES: MotA/TolQ/ExbB proton channel family protein [unclassified Aureispira]|uniref:MotA/TolQ/ExbB proton channel family protein n=1 Tax=unclassified Aureispira TaxID=2649989 RepID=UPI00069771BC|nr:MULTISPECIES: MotA/TolQ/ExbB proton channel family protein [unclassified Aureispira]WMX14352.1 MotA/TolQ/ExbB proton channel family protein [Aureispira sp. CCB-E]
MKKVFVLFFALILSVGTYNNTLLAQDEPGDTTTMVEDTMANEPDLIQEEPAEEPKTMAEPEVEMSLHQVVKKNFIDGGWEFMAIVLICLILGLAIAIERIITLSLATVNTKKLIAELDNAISNGNIKDAQDICKATPGPTAEVLGQGLKRVDDGIDAVEKAIISNGSVQMGLLEKGLVWLALFIALAPMLGFMGTVLGMIDAFDSIEKAGDIQPSMVAGGIKVALLTTVFGLITAIILQIFYNYITAKVDSLVNSMEDATISLIDILIDKGNISTSKVGE